MGKKPPQLPQSLLDAAKKGEEIANKPLSPKARELKERIERSAKEFPERMKDPAFRARFSAMLKDIGDGIAEEQRIMAQLAPIPQRYRVNETFFHKAEERYVQERRVLYPERTEIKYVAGSVITLRSVYVQVDVEGFDEMHTRSLWVWVDEDGWIIRPGVLSGYEYKKKLQKI